MMGMGRGMMITARTSMAAGPAWDRCGACLMAGAACCCRHGRRRRHRLVPLSCPRATILPQCLPADVQGMTGRPGMMQPHMMEVRPPTQQAQLLPLPPVLACSPSVARSGGSLLCTAVSVGGLVGSALATCIVGPPGHMPSAPLPAHTVQSMAEMAILRRANDAIASAAQDTAQARAPPGRRRASAALHPPASAAEIRAAAAGAPALAGWSSLSLPGCRWRPRAAAASSAAAAAASAGAPAAGPGAAAGGRGDHEGGQVSGGWCGGCLLWPTLSSALLHRQVAEGIVKAAT